jgi:hypothetical protein
MYEAKAAGKNCVRFAAESIPNARIERKLIAKTTAAKIEDGKIIS